MVELPSRPPAAATHGPQPTAHPADVTVCMLAGGEGRRMGGRDKGLVEWQGLPLSLRVLQRMAPQGTRLIVSANRHADDYARLWRRATQEPHTPEGTVFADDTDLPPHSGPLAGMLSALRRSPSTWVQFVPCDTPRLPADLVSRLLAAAHDGTDIVVPQTMDGPEVPRQHWVCALVRRSTLASLTIQFAAGERKVSCWIGTCAWRSVSFTDGEAFANINALESPHVSR